MTSDRKIKANRANARASTGPKTAHGRARAWRNARRHGLSLPVCSDPTLSEEVETLARAIAGPDANAETQELARRVAEAQIDCRRVRQARQQLLSKALSDEDYDSCVSVTLKGPDKLARILSEELRRLLAMDRYERRALSRRKIAIQAFDQARVLP